MPSTGKIYGAEAKHLRIAYQVNWDDIGPGTTAAGVSVDMWVSSVAWGFDDDQTLVRSGSFGGSTGYHINSPSGGSVEIYLGNIFVGTFATSYGGGPSFTFNGEITGIYLTSGANPTISVNFTLPARPASAPGVPGTPGASEVGSSSATISWGASVANGTPVTSYRLQVGTSSGFAVGVVHDTTANNLSRAISGLNRNTTYYARVIANSAAGNSPWSATRAFTTLATAPDPMAAPSVSAVYADSATLAFIAPNNGGSPITSYALQVSTVADFSSGVLSFSPGASPFTVTGLQAGLLYYARIRANNAMGSGGWSPSASFTTLSGTWAIVAGAWTKVRVHARPTGSWGSARAWKRPTTTWVP